MKNNLLKRLLLLIGVSTSMYAHEAISENQKYIDEIIYFEVRAGFHSIKEIEEIVIDTVQDNGFEKEFSNQWVKTRIKNMHDDLIVESKKWEKPTDTTLLIEAFKELNKTGILSLHNADYTTSDGEDEVDEILKKMKKQKLKYPRGYCFYHEQDLHRVINDGTLYLAFGDIGKHTNSNMVTIGYKIVKVLKKYHFKIDWDGTYEHRIGISNFHWHMLYNKSINIMDNHVF